MMIMVTLRMFMAKWRMLMAKMEDIGENWQCWGKKDDADMLGEFTLSLYIPITCLQYTNIADASWSLH
jgi:hypothetical protein